MPLPQFSPVSDQVAAHLREELQRGRWGGLMPGRDRLVAELGVSGKTVQLALKQLTKEGWLVAQGTGRRRQIARVQSAHSPEMRVAILNYDPAENDEPISASLLQRLITRGHIAFIAEKTLVELRLDPKRVAGLVTRTKADAWIVFSAPHQVLQWFAGKPIPTLAVYGKCIGVKMAATRLNYEPTMLDLTRQFLQLGHKRIVFLIYRGQYQRTPGDMWHNILRVMSDHGIMTGPYNLPPWEDTPEGFHRLLDSLFQHSPPTALVVEEMPHLMAVMQFCGQRGIRVPKDLSLICLNPSPDLSLFQPPMAHIHWDREPMVRRIVNWVDHVARGKGDHRQTITTVKLVKGGTIGPAPLAK